MKRSSWRTCSLNGLTRVAALVITLLFSPAAWSDPRTETQWSANPVRPGRPFALTLTARWEGEATRYVIGTPQVEFPEEIQRNSVSSRSFREGDENVVRHRWELVAKKKGDFPPLAVRLKVFAAGEKDPSEVTLETEPLVADVARWRGIPFTLLLAGLAAGLLLIGAVAWLLHRRRSRLRQKAEPPAPEQSLEGLREELHACRVRGDTPAFLDTALRLLALAAPSGSPEAREIASLLEQARYGSLRLSGEEMQGWVDRLKRLESSPGGTEPAGRG